jgi:hypothetical protein
MKMRKLKNALARAGRQVERRCRQLERGSHWRWAVNAKMMLLDAEREACLRVGAEIAARFGVRSALTGTRETRPYSEDILRAFYGNEARVPRLGPAFIRRGGGS